MIPYILYAALILTACFIFYKLLLQKETFFNLNRFVLIGCMLLDLDDVIGAKATGTSPAFIKSMRKKGHTMKSLEKYIALKSVLEH